MTSHHFASIPPRAIIGFLCAVSIFPWASAAAPLVSFRLIREGGDRPIGVEVVAVEGVEYVSLNALVEGFAGGCTLLPTRVKVDFQGRSARAAFNQNHVDASLNSFTLRHPILKDDATALIAVDDVPAFFEEAFRARVLRSGPAEARTGTAPLVAIEALDEPPTLANNAEPSAPRPARYAHPWRTIVIDPGHGGADTGCAAAESEVSEKELVLAVAAHLAQAIKTKLSVDVFLTRRSDVDMSNAERAAFVNDKNADLVISVHVGASFCAQAHGFEIFYQPDARHALPGRRAGNTGAPADQSYDIAEAVAAALVEKTSAGRRGIRPAPLCIWKGAGMPVLLIEVGCITHADESARLQSEAYQAEIAEAVATGLVRYLDSMAVRDAPG